jgi:S-methylmethionine-dependent homocysteine/selenocysteine methylase
MSKYRHNLPQLDGRLFLTDGGLETTLLFHEGIELPCFAAFDLLKDTRGVALLRRYYSRYLDIARRRGVGFVLEAPTWRASRDWGARLGYDAERLADANRTAIGLLLEIRDTWETPGMPIIVSGNLGPRGDGYRPATRMSVAQARDYHAEQIETFAQTEADMVSALTLNYVEEAAGIVQASRAAGLPVAISFTLETDGRLPCGTSLAEAIQRTDAHSDGYAAYYMVNCAHPTHFDQVLRGDAEWRRRLRGLRANASQRSHAELDESTDLDSGNPAELGRQYSELRRLLPALSVLGGCCGTDHRHVEAICAACA